MIETDLAVDGGALSYTRAGAGRAIVFLHGWTLDRRMWGPQLVTFARTCLVLAPDRRGFGRSSAPPDLFREADDVVRLLDAVDAPRAVVVGMSQAGRVALDFAHRFADRTDAIVLQGAPFSALAAPADEHAIPVAAYAVLARTGRLAEMKSLWRAHPLMHTGTPEAAACVAAMLADYAGRDLLEDAPAPAREADPAQIGAPALVLTGTCDTPWRISAGDALARALPKASRAHIEAAGHLCNLCASSAYNNVLTDFLRRTA
jgi:pimeloyl-ACP methyl ester carboxylesterase